MNKHFIRNLLWVTLAFTCFICEHSFGADFSKTQLALNWKPEPQFGGFYAADIGGHFKTNRLEVEILPGGAGTPTIQMVAAGKVDFGIVSADEVVLSRSNGSDVVALFAAYQTNPQGIMVHEEKGYKGLQDLFNDPKATLAMQKGLPYSIYLQNKFRAAKAKIVPYQGGIGLFLNDVNFSQQCFVTSEPLEAARKGQKPKVFTVADAGFNPYTTVLVTRASLLKSKSELAKAMVLAVRAGWMEYLQSPEATNRKMAELNPSMDIKTFQQSAEAQKPLIASVDNKSSDSKSSSGRSGEGKLVESKLSDSMASLGVMTLERWRQLVDQLETMKIIKKKPDPASLFQN